MKKIISVLLAVLMLCGCMSVMAFAADSYTKAYSVTTPGENVKKYEITPWDSDSNFVKEGDSFRFVITCLGSYVVNDTCVIKAASTKFPVQNITDPDGIEGEVLYPETVTVMETDKEGNEIEVSYDVYTLTNIQDDMYIYVCNIAPGSISGVLNFLNGFFNFIVTFINWFFGLAKVI